MSAFQIGKKKEKKEVMYCTRPNVLFLSNILEVYRTIVYTVPSLSTVVLVICLFIVNELFCWYIVS